MIKILIFFFIAVGYPKIPLTSIPILLIGIFLYKNNVFKSIKISFNNNGPYFILVFFLFLLINSIFNNSGYGKEMLFVLILIYKMSLGYLIAEIFIHCLLYRPSIIYFYTIFQLLLIAVSAFNNNLYDFLSLFQTPEANEVFSKTFGLRSMGFGIIHNEGVATLVMMYSFLIYKYHSSSLYMYSSPLIYLSAFSSRIGIFLGALSQLLLSPKTFFISVVLIFFCVLFLIDITEGPFSEVFEIINNFSSNGNLSSKSTDAILDMKFFPDNFVTWIIGDGKFFSDYGFYMETDVGFSRMLFFGGITGLSLYILASIYPLFFVNYKNRNFIFYLFAFKLILLFLIINIKGINVQNWAFISFYLFSKENHKYKKISIKK